MVSGLLTCHLGCLIGDWPHLGREISDSIDAVRFVLSNNVMAMFAHIQPFPMFSLVFDHFFRVLSLVDIKLDSSFFESVLLVRYRIRICQF